VHLVGFIIRIFFFSSHSCNPISSPVENKKEFCRCQDKGVIRTHFPLGKKKNADEELWKVEDRRKYVGRFFHAFWKGHIQKRNRFLNSINILPIYTGSVNVTFHISSHVRPCQSDRCQWVIFGHRQSFLLRVSALKFCRLRGKAWTVARVVS